MVLIGDRETGSWWDHITGECVDGKLAGKRLPVSPLLHSTAASALAAHPNARIAVGRQSISERIMSVSFDWMRRSLGRFLVPLAKSTMGDEDGRLPRWEIGLGVWSDTGSVLLPERHHSGKGPHHHRRVRRTAAVGLSRSEIEHPRRGLHRGRLGPVGGGYYCHFGRKRRPGRGDAGSGRKSALYPPADAAGFALVRVCASRFPDAGCIGRRGGLDGRHKCRPYG